MILPIGLPVFSNKHDIKLNQDHKDLSRLVKGLREFHLFQHNPSREIFHKLLDSSPFSPQLRLGFWPKLAIQMDQCFMMVIGDGKNRSNVFMFHSKKKIGSNSSKLGSHSRKVATKRYTSNLIHSTEIT
ncbi:hypothetical protein H5410_004971 [Solanum commersonii]|uniref:Uncharacterized protein n=1 Tax=Solanum commersonii TaxID=4109 RepID=A0A9J6A5D1_SOLCO|nr:hypothetical protein H5410_004971 [Solanum commersonii]